MGIISDLKAIIDLLHKRDETNKLKLDTEIARHELADRQRMIQQVQLEDVQKYDPNTERLLATVSEHYHPEPRAPDARPPRNRAPLAVAVLLALIAVILVLVWLL